MPPIKAIFLDIDNTLLDFDAYVRDCMQKGFAHFNLRSYEPWMYDVFTEENNKLWRQIEEGTLTLPQLQKIRWNIIFARIGIEFGGAEFEHYFRRFLNESAIPEAGALQLLQALQGQYILCAASNGPTQQQLHRLQLAGMLPLLQHVFVSEQLGVAKPAAGFFDAAFALLNENRAEPLRPADCLMLGDSLTADIAGGKECGMRTCWYTRGQAKTSPLPDYTIRSLSELPALLDARNG